VSARAIENHLSFAKRSQGDLGKLLERFARAAEA
jgi:hypothetical protein